MWVHDDPAKCIAAGLCSDWRIHQRDTAVISYNFGAGQFDRVKKTIRLMLTVTLSCFPDLCGVYHAVSGSVCGNVYE